MKWRDVIEDMIPFVVVILFLLFLFTVAGCVQVRVFTVEDENDEHQRGVFYEQGGKR